jgi:hypothetical protein
MIENENKEQDAREKMKSRTPRELHSSNSQACQGSQSVFKEEVIASRTEHDPRHSVVR